MSASAGGLGTPQLLFELARGGMGSVHLARLAGIGDFERFVVVKRILDRGADPSIVDRFLSEARVAACIHHANVVGTHHVGVDEQGLYMVLDYIEGGSLASLTNRAALRGSRVPIPVVLRIALDALAGLGAVHTATDAGGVALGIVHRDVSLQNVLVGRDGIARLADFGIAKSASTASSTKTGSLVGKLLYLPPEYIRNQATDQTVDIYMLGITLWCAITGQEPWSAVDEVQMMHQILTQPLPSLASSLGEPVAPQLEALILKACDPAPTRRFQSAQEMTLAVDALGRERGWVASQHDVATFVEGLLGVDLGRRRQRIADVLARAGQPVERHALGAQTKAVVNTATKRLSAGRLGWALATAALLAAGVVYLVWGRGGVDTTASEPQRISRDAPALPNYPTPARAPNVDTPAAVREVQPDPVVSPARSSTSSSRAQPPPQPRGELPTPPAAPDQISSRNPYR